ncbi:unnamed protein product [Brachionus calyciflorus]|uniref:Uncharacterized protein n=1 Tax=Brachionus calyciflorus TaxID=104777 RepID=A0A813VCL3_9BILA|nr:unnamed protein product [Brachionus calyciflorus]
MKEDSQYLFTKWVKIQPSNEFFQKVSKDRWILYTLKKDVISEYVEIQNNGPEVVLKQSNGKIIRISFLSAYIDETKFCQGYWSR